MQAMNESMESHITPERIVATAEELDHEEFTRAELAAELGTSRRELKDAIRAARRSGRIKKVRKNESGETVFRLTGS
jgi:hypothetical protein